MKTDFKKMLFEQKGSLSLSESLSLKAVSLLLSLILWISVIGFKPEEMKKNIAFEPLLPPGRVLTNKIPNQIQITFLGSRVLLKEVEKKLKPIRPDLSRVKENYYSYSFSEDQLGDIPSGVKVLGVYPPALPMRLEEVIQKRVTVRVSTFGQLAEGLELKNIQVNPSQVTISGPKSILEPIDFVSTEEVNLESAAHNKEEIVTLEVDTSLGIDLPKEKVVQIKIFTKKTK